MSSSILQLSDMINKLATFLSIGDSTYALTQTQSPPELYNVNRL
jgi:hypothetical protein